MSLSEYDSWTANFSRIQGRKIDWSLRKMSKTHWQVVHREENTHGQKPHVKKVLNLNKQTNANLLSTGIYFQLSDEHI